MDNSLRLLLFFGLSSAGIVFAIPASEKLVTNIVVITSDQYPVNVSQLSDNVVVQIFNLDAIKKAEKALSQGLPKNEKDARTKIEKIIEREGRDQFEQRLIAGYQPLLKAMQFSIDRIPAVIFDERALVYGVSDIVDAYDRYHSWLNALDINDE